MHIVPDFLFLLFVLVQLVDGAPIRIKRNLDKNSDFVADPTITGKKLELSPLDTNPDPHSLPIMASVGDWDNADGELDPPSPSSFEDFSSFDHDSEHNRLQHISYENDGTLFSSDETAPYMDHSTDLSIYPRAEEGAKEAEAAKIMDNAGSALDKAAKYVDGIPEVGEILGPAVQVVSWVVKAISKLLDGISKAERESAKKRGAFTHNVTEQALKEHPGWLVVTVHPAHSVYFQGREHYDWAHKITTVETHAGIFAFHVYSARAGIFINEGDGGWQNWAYAAPADKLKAYGDQGHRLVYKGGAPTTGKPKSGNCGLHVYQYQMHEKNVNPVGHYTVVAIVKDAAGLIVGFEGDGNASAGTLVRSQLPNSLRIKAGTTDSAPLTFRYGKDMWKSDNKARCKVGSYDGGSRQMDCSFKCDFSPPASTVFPPLKSKL
ncbi:hypothetical protein F5878DRAFT_627273 [Lentinula raphanica]|uniref:Uncharacterized protein n=1 Tax=Lentinula raphanica TaxID=153919 RepID=A0AA38P3L0_9AGAR|nr:hypothetical protein F5878DRAFT_627273 [Lentinula raphanica]